jgi:hypothetical protein
VKGLTLPATDEDIIRDLLHRYTDHVRPPASIATEVAARQRHRDRRRIVSLTAAGAALGAAAGVIAVVPGHSSTPPSAAPTGSASRTPAVRPSQPPTVNSKLMSLAALIIKASGGPLPGNASLIIRTQIEGGIPPQVSYNLYTDSGAYYAGGDKPSLMEAVAQHQNMANGIDAREVAAARYAATGDLTTAVKRMATALPGDAWLLLTGTAQRTAWEKGMTQEWPILRAKGMKTPPKMPTGKALQSIIDNRVWNNGVDALYAGAGSPQIRAGVLRLLSTISEVTVTDSMTGGQPTLTLTAGPEVFGGAAEEVLTISAQTGMPIKAEFPAQGNVPSDVQTFQVLRVTMANIEAGKF